MANEEHLAILKKGVSDWNEWRMHHPELFELSGADLKGADLHRADLGLTDLCEADFNGANLDEADLGGADLSDANFTGANLAGANLNGADLRGADFSEARLWETIFADVDLSEVKGLDKCFHAGPSVIDHRTLMKSGDLPLEFLRGVGLPDDYIQALPGFRNQPFDYYSCFISYAHKGRDKDFAERLHSDLQAKGIRCWFAPHDLKIGDKTRLRIDETIRTYDKLLLVLSRNSLKSDWVAYEAERARAQERKRKKIVLFPIRLDNAIMKEEGGWADYIREERNIGDFRNWKDHDSYQVAFERLMRDLKNEAKERP